MGRLEAYCGAVLTERVSTCQRLAVERGWARGSGFELVTEPHFALEMAAGGDLAGPMEGVLAELANRATGLIIGELHLVDDAILSVLEQLITVIPIAVTVDTVHPEWSRLSAWLDRLGADRLPVGPFDAHLPEGIFERLTGDEQIAAMFLTLSGVPPDPSAVPGLISLTHRFLHHPDRDPALLPGEDLPPLSPDAHRTCLEYLSLYATRTSTRAEALFASGDSEGALLLCTSALDSAPPDDQAALWLVIARADPGRCEEAVRALIRLGRASDAATLDLSSPLDVEVAIARRQHTAALEAPARTELQEARLSVWPGWKPTEKSLGSPWDQLVRLMAADPTWSEDLESVATAEESANPARAVEAWLVLAAGCLLTAETGRISGALQRARRLAAGVPDLEAVVAGARWADRVLREGHPDESFSPGPVWTDGVAAALAALAAADRGRTREALTLLDDMVIPAHQTGRSFVSWVRAEVLLNGGRVGRVADTTPEPAVDDPAATLARLAAAWAAWEVGEDILSLKASHLGLAGAAAEVEALRLADSDPGGGAVRFAEAAALWAPVHRRGELRSQWAQGELWRRAGEVEQAVETLQQTDRLARELGLKPLSARCRRSLRRAGVSVRAAGSSDGILSAREREVLDLVRGGLTSREIADQLGVASSTVETQIRSAMTKLGVRTRLEAATHPETES